MILKKLLPILLLIVSFIQAIELTKEEVKYLADIKEISFVITDYPPFEFVNNQKNYDGMTVELIRWIATETGFKVNFNLQSFADAKASILSAKNDVLTTFFYSEERDKIYDFTQKLFEIPASIFIRTERTDIKDIDDLKGKTIAVQKEDFAIEFLQKQKINCTFEYTDNFGEATQLVADGKADALIGDEQVVLYHLFSNNISEKVKKVGPKQYGGISCMGTQQGNQILISILNKGIKEAQNQGIIEKINIKWLGVQLGKNQSLWEIYGKIILFVFLIALSIILILWLWNTRLKKLVARRAKELETEMHKRLESEKLYRLITDNTIDVIWSMDLDFNFTYISPSAENFLQFPPRKSMGNDFDNYLTEQDADIFKLAVNKMLNNANNHNDNMLNNLVLEMEFISQSGDAIFGESHISILFDEADKPTGIVGVTRDITLKRKAEEALKKSEQQKKLLLNAIPDMIFTISGDGRYLDFKPGTIDPLINADKIIGSYVQDMPLSKELIDYLLGDIKKAIATNELQISEYSLGDGNSKRFFEARVTKIGDNEVISMVRDVGEKIRLQEEINKTQKLESIGILAGGIAHDFNNYLTGILGNISLVKLKAENGENFSTLLTEAEKAALRAKDLTQQLLTFAKGGAPIKEQISIELLIRDSAEFVLRGSKSACSYHFADDLWLAEIDKGQISQVIQNIVLNSSQAMPDGGSITIAAENVINDESSAERLTKGKYLKISISDNGPGIDENYLHKIFEPYFTTREKGHGLGLSICHSIVHKHGGAIEVISELGKGALFVIYLPVANQQIIKSKKENIIQKFRGNGKKVLFMDDEEMLRDFAANLFENFDYKFECVEDGVIAVQAYKKAFEQGEEFDLVIMDLTIPGGVGGETAVKDILTINPSAKVIVSSGYSNHPIMSNYQSYGFKGVIVKPFELDKFFKVIKQVLEGV